MAGANVFELSGDNVQIYYSARGPRGASLSCKEASWSGSPHSPSLMLHFTILLPFKALMSNEERGRG